MPAVEKKPVKKEEEIDNGADEKISAFANKKKKLSLDNAKTRVTDSKVKKEEPKDDEYIDEKEKKKPSKKVEPIDEYIDEKKPSIRKTVTKTEEKTIVKDKKTVVRTVKKVYDLPGQKRDPPEERDPLRIFYESLYEQRPESEMASLWMMECGLLPMDEAKEVFERKQKNQLQKKIIASSPMKPASVKKEATTVKMEAATVKKEATTVKKETTTIKKETTTASSMKKKPVAESKASPKQSTIKKRKLIDRSSDSDDDDDFVPINKLKTNKRPKEEAS